MKQTFLFAFLCASSAAAEPAPIPWEGRGQYRALVRVAPVDLGARTSDELVASYDLDLSAPDSKLPDDRAIDFDSVQLMRYLPEGGRAEKYTNHAYATSEYDRPFQFYDATYPEHFPDYDRYLSHYKDTPFLRLKVIPFGARHFNAIGDGSKGRFVWPHTQQGDAPSWYAIYFDLLPQDALPFSPPTGFVGDGSSRSVRKSNRFGPPGNINGRVIDWNDDGLHDLLFGASDGHVSLYLNSGQPGKPRFRTKKLLLDSDNVPIDVGYSSCPWLVDWDGDRKVDLLVGAEKGCIVWFKNSGETSEPKYQFMGFLESDGMMIVTPAKPIAEGRSEEAYKEDYFPIPIAIDWDGDGDLDLLLGGYVTGLTFLYENIAKPNSPPELSFRGPLIDSEGKTIDTGWMAAPAVDDLDGDGDLDLVLGCKPVTAGGGDMRDSSRAILFYENTGTRSLPRMTKRPFPSNTAPPFGGMIVPSLVNWDGDEMLDLVAIDARQKVHVFQNIGTRTQPHFDFKSAPLAGEWQPEGISANAFVDVNGDGLLDVLNGFSAMLNSGEPSPGFFRKRIGFTADGKIVKHSVPNGDENPGLILHDFTGDGMLDGIYGAHSGYVWFHENRGTNEKPNLESSGKQLRLVNGEQLKVGLPEGAPAEKMDFTVLQGARPKPVAADFNQDGLPDLIIGDAYGLVRYYENIGVPSDAVFAKPVLIANFRSRLYLSVVDWNSDGVSDLAVLKGGIRVFINKGSKGKCEFLPPVDIKVPATQGYLLNFALIDWNRDGDEDLLCMTSSGDFCFTERSFLTFGYCAAKLQVVESKLSVLRDGKEN